MAAEFSNQLLMYKRVAQYPTIPSEFYLNAFNKAPTFADALAIIRHKSYRFAIGNDYKPSKTQQ